MSPVVLLALASAHAWDEAPDVLFVGNSYTYYNDLEVLAEQSLRGTVPALAAARTDRRAGPALSFSDHVARIEGANAAWVDAFDGPETWDVVVFQDQSRIPGLRGIDADYDESLAAFAQLDAYAAATGAHTVLFMTWGRRDGDTRYPEHYPDFLTMNAQLDAGYRAFAATAGRPVSVAPVGRAFEAVYDRVTDERQTPETPGSDFHRLYDPDGTHPSALGSGLAAGVFTATLTGHYPDADHLPGVEPADADWVVDTIRSVVVPFGNLHFPWAMPWADLAEAPDLDPIAGRTVISGRSRCITAGVAASLGTVSNVVVGGTHGGVPGCGRIWMTEGSSADFVDLVVGEAGHGEVRMLGGRADFDDLTLDGELVIVDGDVTLRGASGVRGTVQIQRGNLVLDGWSGGLEVDGGLVELRSSASGGRLAQRGGTLQLAPIGAGPALALTEDSVLGGRVLVLELQGVEVVLISAPSLETDGLLVSLPSPWEWTVTDDGSQMALVASRDTLVPYGPGDMTGLGGPPGASSGGCSSGSAPPSGGAALLLGLVGLLRRRRPAP